MRTKIRTDTSGTFSFQEHAEGTKGSLEKEGTLKGEEQDEDQEELMNL